MDKDKQSAVGRKISDLDSFPEGYLPDLDSKWSIIENAVHNDRGRKRFLWIWYASAAILIIAVMFSYFNPRQTEHQTAIKTEQQSPTINSDVSSTSKITEPVKKRSSSTKNNTRKEADYSLPAPADEEAVVISYDACIDELPPASEDAADNNSSGDRKKKKRFITHDFGEAIIPLAQKPEDNNRIHIRINPAFPASADNNEYAAPVFRHNF